MGAMTVPFALLIFFWEVNAPRNISIFSVVSMFFVGGVLSLVCTLILYNITGAGDLSYGGAMLVGFVEEAGKIVVVAYYMRKTNSKYILNGLLLGACVGAGFAVFESAGYAFQCLLSTGADSAMMDITLLRGVLAVGGHVVWTAIAGAALAAYKTMYFEAHVCFLLYHFHCTKSQEGSKTSLLQWMKENFLSYYFPPRIYAKRRLVIKAWIIRRISPLL